MFLSNIKLWNFRKFGSRVEDIKSLPTEPSLDLTLKKGLNVLIGENDSGKTAILDAVKLVLKTHSLDWIGPHDDDFYLDSKRFRIELEFRDFLDEEAKYFTEWLGWEGEGADARVYLRLIYDVSRDTDKNKILPADVMAGVDEIGRPLTAEAREQIKTTYLKPLRDAERELAPRKGSRLSKIFHGHDAFKNGNENHQLIETLNEFSASIESYFEPAAGVPDQKGKELKETIDNFIKDFCDESQTSQLKVSESNLKDILEMLRLSIKDGKNLGLGTLNRLFMASELLHLKKLDWFGLRLGLIEELEAHLHPQAQMKVIESLQRQDEIQFLLTTHSPNLASKVKLENIVICCDANAFSLGKGKTRLITDDYTFLEKFLDVTKSNLFFAKGVILVEGWAEELLIPSLARSIDCDLTKKGVSIVNVASTAFLRYSRILVRRENPQMKIPVAIVTDVDVRTYEKRPSLDDMGKPRKNDQDNTIYEYLKLPEEGITEETTRKIEAREAELTLQNVHAFLAPHWTLEYSLLKSVAFSEMFQEVLKDVHTGTNWDEAIEQKLAEKLINKGLDKTEIAYKLANMIDGLAEPKVIGDDDTIAYLANAIKYATGSDI